MPRRAFTIIELLVVMSIITLLISLLLPAMSKSRLVAMDAKCLSNQRQILNAILAYSNDQGTKLPMSGRSWPHMGMLDLYEGCVRSYINDDMALLRCPRDYDIGWIARWWRAWYGGPMTAADHQYLKAGENPEVPFSYYWYVKMYWAVDMSSGVLVGGHTLQQHRVESVKHTSGLFTHVCFVDHSGTGEGGFQTAFIDAHAEFVPLDQAKTSCAPWYGPYNLDWTCFGIFGTDLK